MKIIAIGNRLRADGWTADAPRRLILTININSNLSGADID